MTEGSALEQLIGAPMILYGVLFTGILLLVEGIYRVASDSRVRSEAQVNRRLSMLASGVDPHQVLEQLRRQRGAKGDASGILGWIEPLVERLDRLMSQAGMTMTRTRLVIIMVALAAVAFTGFRLIWALPTVSSLVLGLGIGMALPLMVILKRRKRRLNRFAEQLPEATDLIVRSLRVGHPLGGAFTMVASELPDPIGTEFGIAVDEMTYGLDLLEAVNNLTQRMGVPDLDYMAVAISIQYGTGGNLAEVLQGLATVIRDRFQMYRKIKAVSAEGRMSSTFLSAFPLVVGSAIWFLMPDYYTRVIDHPWFTYMAIMAGVLCALNFLVMRWLTSFKV